MNFVEEMQYISIMFDELCEAYIGMVSLGGLVAKAIDLGLPKEFIIKHIASEEEYIAAKAQMEATE